MQLQMPPSGKAICERVRVLSLYVTNILIDSVTIPLRVCFYMPWLK